MLADITAQFCTETFKPKNSIAPKIMQSMVIACGVGSSE
jgi:hypothetical protein